MNALIAAGAFALLPTFVWFFLFWMMAAHYADLSAHGHSGSWDVGVYLPLTMTLSLLGTIYVFTFVKREPGLTVVIAILALLLVVPFAARMANGV